MKKIIAMICATLMLVSLAACSGPATNTDDGKFVVGICQIEPHVALDDATRGFVDALSQALGEDKVEFLNQNAAGDTNTLLFINVPR